MHGSPSAPSSSAREEWECRYSAEWIAESEWLERESRNDPHPAAQQVLNAPSLFHMLRKLSLLLFFAVAAPYLHAASFIGNPNFIFSNDVAYVPGGGPVQSGERRETMDIYRPTGATGPLPVLLLVHGGGWNSSSNSAYIADKDFLATGKYVVATMNYRLNSVVEPLIEQVDNVKAAIRFPQKQTSS